jgi:uncharacterized membrane protein (UPF0127 family)
VNRQWTGLLVLASLAIAPAPAGEIDGWAVAVLPSGAEFSLELAVRPETRVRGYMFREEVGPREGMLFVFEAVERHGIWMRNCEVALDIVWLDENLRVVEVAADRQPCPQGGRCPTVRPLRPARYVLEVAAGNAARHGLVPGARVELLTEIPR